MKGVVGFRRSGSYPIEDHVDFKSNFTKTRSPRDCIAAVNLRNSGVPVGRQEIVGGKAIWGCLGSEGQFTWRLLANSECSSRIEWVHVQLPVPSNPIVEGGKGW